MSVADPEMELDPSCPHCGSRGIFTASASPGQREMPLYPRAASAAGSVTILPSFTLIRRPSLGDLLACPSSIATPR